MTIGAYAFVTADYETLDFPLDLWLQWHLPLFDEISLVTFGHIDLERNDRLTITEFPQEIDKNSFKFYLFGKEEAQKKLKTDWKVALDIDEFISHRIDALSLKNRKTHALKIHHLYGNINTEIHNAFPPHFFRVHYGNKTILGDGGGVRGPYEAKLNLNNIIQNLFHWKDFNYMHRSPLTPKKFIEVWHTGACRRPQIMSIKWRKQIQRELNENITQNMVRLKHIESDFNYGNYKIFGKDTYISSVTDDKLPKILVENAQRFNHYDFEKKSHIATATDHGVV